MEKIFEDNELCSGCAACYNICPQNAIKMQKDERGFLYPVIEQEKCINCGICNKTCIIKHSVEKQLEQKIFGLKNKDQKVREKAFKQYYKFFWWSFFRISEENY